MTLLELMVTVAIAGILAGISLYSFGNNRYRSECYGTLRTLRIVMSEARQQAQAGGLPVFLRFERLPGRGIGLDGQGKVFMRWEKLGCNGADTWTNCPASTCLTDTNVCAVNESGNFSTAIRTTCCVATGDWVEVADTLRILNDGEVISDEAAGSPLNHLCWNGLEGSRKLSAVHNGQKCVFDDSAAETIPDVVLTCVDKDDVRETNASAMGETDGVLHLDALTGLTRLTLN